MDQVIWLVPLLIMPGIALLINSTAMRYAQIHDEVHHLLGHENEKADVCAFQLQTRARLFRNSLVGLYLCVNLLAVGSIAGAVADFTDQNPEWIVLGFACMAVICLVYTSVELIRESLLSLKIVNQHLQQVQNRYQTAQH